MQVSVLVEVKGREVPIEKVADKRIVSALQALGQQVEAKLRGVKCKTHGKGPVSVRVHVDARGNADIRYDSCCDALKDSVARALG